MKYLITVILLISCSVALADYFELDHKLHCDDAPIIIQGLSEELKEEPIWIGKMTESVVAILFVNQDLGLWTYVIMSESKACVMNSGSGYTSRMPGFIRKQSLPVDTNKYL